MLAVQAEKGESGLLLDKGGRRAEELASSQQGNSRADQGPQHAIGERLSHFHATEVGNGVKGKAVEDLVVVLEVLADRVDDQAHNVRVFVHEQRHGKVSL